MPDSALPVAASAALVETFHGPRRAALVTGRGRRAALVEVAGGPVVVLERPGGARLPIAAVVTRPSLPAVGWAGAVGGGTFTLGHLTLRPVRWWDPRPVSVVGGVPLSRLDRLARVLPALPVTLGAEPDVDGLVGYGDGSTPAGDDWLSAHLVTLVALGATDKALRLWSAIEPRLGRTTPLSAALLRAAARGGACGPVNDLLAALRSGRAVEPAARRVLALGGTSGQWLAHGLLAALVPAGEAVGAGMVARG